MNEEAKVGQRIFILASEASLSMEMVENFVLQFTPLCNIYYVGI